MLLCLSLHVILLGHVTKSINEVIVILYASSPAGALSLSTGLVSSCCAVGLLPSELTVHREDSDCKSSLLKLTCIITYFLDVYVCY